MVCHLLGLVGSLPTASSLLAWPIDFGMHHPHVSRERIVTGEGFLLRAEMTADLLLARVVDRVLVAREIVGPREDRVAWLSGRRVDPLALVGAGLRVARGAVAPHEVAAGRSLPVGLPLVLL